MINNQDVLEELKELLAEYKDSVSIIDGNIEIKIINLIKKFEKATK